MAKILIIEDEPEMARGLMDNLVFEGYEVKIETNGEAGLQYALANPIDLILLDLMLPKLSGYEVCKALRAQNKLTPIIMLTAKGQEIDKVLGLELGADDYVTKPFGLRELLARIHAQLRRHKPDTAQDAETCAFGDVILDFKHYHATKAGEEIELTAKEFEILRFLISHRGATVKRTDLLDKVWGLEDYPTTRTVDNHILKLRKKIESDPANPEFIITVHGIGYKFLG
ncbi:response regulator transcription factor [candidate division KSB1 bacterium]|nr:response regulator transcription factor [candidate division KSB1 bacterium]